MLLLDELIVTQNSVRCVPQINSMLSFVRRGGHFTSDALLANSEAGGKLMRVAVLPDGRKLLCDGLHRAVAKDLAGVTYIRDDEVTVIELTLQDFRRPAVSKGWFTPYDPETEVRLPDFGQFRSLMMRMLSEGQEVESFIRDRRSHYAEPRRRWAVQDVSINIIREVGSVYGGPTP